MGDNVITKYRYAKIDGHYILKGFSKEYILDGRHDFSRVEVPPFIDVIEDSAFAGFPIKNITFSNKIISIGQYAFKNCPIEGTLDLSKMNSPNGVFINRGAFTGTNISKLILPKSYYIGMIAFESCNNLISVESTKELPKSTANNIINEFAFYDCPKLERLRLNNITHLCNGAFAFCQNLKYINLKFIKSNSGIIPYIGEGAFNECNIDTLKIHSTDNLKIINSSFGSFGTEFRQKILILDVDSVNILQQLKDTNLDFSLLLNPELKLLIESL